MLRLQKVIPSGTIILDFPSNRNALSREMVTRLSEAFNDFHREKSVRAVILASSGATFSSGADLNEWQATASELEPLPLWQDIVGEIQELIEIMLRFPKPIIASIDGPVVGLGMSLVLASDLVVASDKASFSLPAPRHGLVSGIVGPLLVFRCGASIASRLMLGSEAIDADEAYRVQLVHYRTQSQFVWARCHALANEIASGAAESVQMTKRLLNEMVGESLLMHLTSGAATTATACSTAAAIEGLNAFKEKRPPQFP
jgi:methylglutaconyl-CoA hydratase